MATIKEQIKQQILDIIFKNINKDSCLVFLFGSFAGGNERISSDIDIGIHCGEKLKPGKSFALKDELNERVRTLRKIDLVDFADVKDEVFFKYSLSEAELWYQGKDCKVTLESLKRLC